MAGDSFFITGRCTIHETKWWTSSLRLGLPEGGLFLQCSNSLLVDDYMELISYIFFTNQYTGQNNAINHPVGNGWNPTYKNGDDWGMVYGIVFSPHYMFYYPTLGIRDSHDWGSI